MLAVIAAILLAVAWFIHGSGAGHVPVWFNAEGLVILAWVLLALHLAWPVYPWRRQ